MIGAVEDGVELEVDGDVGLGTAEIVGGAEDEEAAIRKRLPREKQRSLQRHRHQRLSVRLRQLGEKRAVGEDEREEHERIRGICASTNAQKSYSGPFRCGNILRYTFFS